MRTEMNNEWHMNDYSRSCVFQCLPIDITANVCMCCSLGCHFGFHFEITARWFNVHFVFHFGVHAVWMSVFSAFSNAFVLNTCSLSFCVRTLQVDDTVGCEFVLSSSGHSMSRTTLAWLRISQRTALSYKPRQYLGVTTTSFDFLHSWKIRTRRACKQTYSLFPCRTRQSQVWISGYIILPSEFSNFRIQIDGDEALQSHKFTIPQASNKISCKKQDPDSTSLGQHRVQYSRHKLGLYSQHSNICLMFTVSTHWLDEVVWRQRKTNY